MEPTKPPPMQETSPLTPRAKLPQRLHRKKTPLPLPPSYLPKQPLKMPPLPTNSLKLGQKLPGRRRRRML